MAGAQARGSFTRRVGGRRRTGPRWEVCSGSRNRRRASGLWRLSAHSRAAARGLRARAGGATESWGASIPSTPPSRVARGAGRLEVSRHSITERTRVGLLPLRLPEHEPAEAAEAAAGGKPRLADGSARHVRPVRRVGVLRARDAPWPVPVRDLPGGDGDRWCGHSVGGRRRGGPRLRLAAGRDGGGAARRREGDGPPRAGPRRPRADRRGCSRGARGGGVVRGTSAQPRLGSRGRGRPPDAAGRQRAGAHARARAGPPGRSRSLSTRSRAPSAASSPTSRSGRSPTRPCSSSPALW
jgi:hypothetical protein